MLAPLQQLARKVVTPFTLRDLDGFPYNDYTDNADLYASLERWYDGSALEETQDQAGKKIELYPLHLNPIKSAVLKHAYALFGEFPDDLSGTLVTAKAIVLSEKDRQVVEEIEESLAATWFTNNGAALMLENGIASQVYGGCVFKVSWVAQEERVRIDKILPEEFVAIPYANDPWRLKKAWVIRKIDWRTAEEYGVTVVGEYAYYIEYWTEDEYQILINDSPIIYEELGTEHILGGDNPFGFVPFVYIPHERLRGFYGVSLINDAVQGITKELNLRMADAGDATNDQSHSILAMRNVRGTPSFVRLANSVPVLNLGSGASLTGNEVQPDLFSVSRSQITDAMLKLNKELQEQFRQEVMVPAIAYGEDEGSQRSAVTLTTRMWPLISHIKSERAFWSTGLIVLNQMILKIMARKGISPITAVHLRQPLKIKWNPILPRDREAFVQEMVNRAGVNLGSIQHLLRLIGDVDDIDVVMGEIQEWVKFQADTQAEAQASAFQQAGGQNGMQNQGQKGQKKVGS